MTEAHRSSTGQDFTSAGWLDAHFETCRPEYEAMVRSVGIEAGGRVLDAGCGNGGFLPLLGELVGPTGSIAALDLDPDNLTAAQARVAENPLPCPLTLRHGDVRTLPFADGEFDVLWCANTMQYLATADIPATLAEFQRVVRPGGVIALKDYEGGHMVFSPADPSCRWHLYDALAEVRGISLADLGTLRSRTMRGWLRAAGCTDVWQRTTLMERWYPLTPAGREYLGSYFEFLGREAQTRNVPPEDRVFWQQQTDRDAPEAMINQPDFYWCEGAVVAVGRVPA